MTALTDNHDRIFTYLRLSLTDACNFRCQYCLPNGYVRNAKTGEQWEDTHLTLTEIENLVRGFSAMGTKKVRLTGGEPTLRPDIIEIVRCISGTPGITEVALTTNGYRLNSLLEPLKAAGLTALNISLDSLNQDRFGSITGSKLFENVYSAIDNALNLGFKCVKLNAVLLKENAADELDEFKRFLLHTPLTVRFIELMETGTNAEYFHSQHISADWLRRELDLGGWKLAPRSANAGPAAEFSHPDYAGRIGIIAPYSKDFCATCNRLRVTSRGKLKLCLFGNGEHSLRHLLQDREDLVPLTETVRLLIQGKAPAHKLHVGDFGSTPHLASIGG